MPDRWLSYGDSPLPSADEALRAPLVTEMGERSIAEVIAGLRHREPCGGKPKLVELRAANPTETDRGRTIRLL